MQCNAFVNADPSRFYQIARSGPGHPKHLTRKMPTCGRHLRMKSAAVMGVSSGMNSTRTCNMPAN
jgi:hypothetical protein